MDIYAEDFGFTYDDHRRIDEFLSALEELCFLSHLSENIRTYGLTEPVRHVLDYDKTSVMIFGAESLNNTALTSQAALEGLGTFIMNILKAIKDFFVWFFKLIGKVFFGYKESKNDSEEKFKKKKEERDYFKDKNTSTEDKEYSKSYWDKKEEEAKQEQERAKKSDEENRRYWEEAKRRAEDYDKNKQKKDAEWERAHKEQEEAYRKAKQAKEEQDRARRAQERAETAKDYAERKIIKYKGARFRMAKVVAIDEFLMKMCATKYDSLSAFLEAFKSMPNIDIFSEKCNYTMWIEIVDGIPRPRVIRLEDDEEMKQVDIKDSGWDARKVSDIDQYFSQVFIKLHEDGRLDTMFKVCQKEERDLQDQVTKLEKLGDNAPKDELENVKKKLNEVIIINKIKASLVTCHGTAIRRVVDRTMEAIHVMKVLHSYSQM